MDQDKTLDSKLRVSGNALMQCPKCDALYASNIAYCTADGTKLEKNDPTNPTAKLFAEKYEILDEIGSGGMGTVYRVRQIMLNKICALKVIPAESVNDVLISRFQQEAKLMAALDHASLGRILDFGTYQNQPYMVMELIDGKPLNKMISTGPLQPEEAVEIFGQVLEALSHAHKRGVLHRDVKPSNIMIKQLDKGTPRAILLDFGIAKKFDTPDDADPSERSKTQGLTRTGEMIGSPLYMSPEQARGEKMTERADLYSLGCALFESLTGTPPLVGKSTVDTLILHMEEQAPTLKEASLGKEFPAGLERVVSTLLAKDPGKRYQTADEAKRALSLALTSSAAILEPTYNKPQFVVNPWLLILAAVSLISTISIAAYLTIQGELALRKTTLPPADTDKIKLDTTTLAVADGLLLQQSDPDDESEDDEVVQLKVEQEKVLLPNKVTGKEKKLPLKDRKLNPEEVKLIEQNTGLEQLGLMNARYPKAMLGRLSGKVQILRLTHSRVTDEDLKLVAKNLYLNQLYINANPVTSAGLRYLSPLKLLWHLELANTHVDAAGISILRELPSLTALSVRNNTDINDQAIAEISTLVGLKSLDISQTSISGKNIAMLRRLPMLADLKLEENHLTDRDIAGLNQVSSLVALDISRNKITAAGLKNLLPLKHLVNLRADRNPIDDTAVDALLKMPQIQKLSLASTRLTRNGVIRLAELPNLKEINLRRVSNLDESFVHEFMSKSQTCDRFIFLPARGEGYDRAEWTMDEKRKQRELMEKSKSAQ